VTGPLASSPLPSTDTPSRPSRGLLLLMIAVTVGWCALLIVLAWRTANPVALNRDQVLRADFVVTGKVESEPVIGEVSVSREWKKNGLTGKIHVENLGDAHARRGETYLLPLAPSPTGYRVLEARLANSELLIYPANQAAIEQLEQILADQSAKK
jgi:hypothetical protein